MPVRTSVRSLFFTAIDDADLSWSVSFFGFHPQMPVELPAVNIITPVDDATDMGHMATANIPRGYTVTVEIRTSGANALNDADAMAVKIEKAVVLRADLMSWVHNIQLSGTGISYEAGEDNIAMLAQTWNTLANPFADAGPKPGEYYDTHPEA